MYHHSIGLFTHPMVVFGALLLLLGTASAGSLRGPSGERELQTATDLRAFINAELAKGLKDIYVPPGKYRVTPVNKEHLRFANRRDVTIHAEGVELICTETTRAITIYKCSNFKIVGLTIDYDPLPYTQGRIWRISSDKTVADIELFDGYPSANLISGEKYEIFDPQTRELRYGSYYTYNYAVSDASHFALTQGSSYKGEKVGDIIAIGVKHAPGGSIPHGVYINESSNVILEDVTLYAANTFGFLEEKCTSTHYLRCTIDRRPLATDYMQRGDARIRSTNSDAYHSKHATIGPRIESCTAKYNADDSVAINGSYDMVLKAEGTTIHVLGKNNGISVQAGDSLEIISFTGERLADATLLSVGSTYPISDADKSFLFSLGLDQGMKDKMRTVWTVQIDRVIALPKGSLIASSNRMGNGFVITGGRFGNNRSRGILVKASNGVISNNVIDSSAMVCIKLAPEYWWLEAGSSNNVQITGNTIQNCGTNSMEVSAKGGGGSTSPAGAHNTITIENNTISNTGQETILVTSTKGLVLRNNNMPKPAVLTNCEDVTM